MARNCNANRNQEELEQLALERMDNLIKSFQKKKPPTYNGTGKPDDAKEWIHGIEKVFGRMRCSTHEKVVCATYQLEGEADLWWESVRRTFTNEAFETMTWDEFKEAYLTRYITLSFRHKRENEVWKLRQGNCSVEEYDRAFNQLARYAPAHVDTDAKRAEQFRQGLRPEIGVPLSTHDTLTYAQALSKALNAEAQLPEEERRQEKRKWEGPQGQSSNQNSKGKKPWARSNQPNYQKPQVTLWGMQARDDRLL
ncbi:uncharacterized protein LOC131013791 [Salvia miltiorrhiza]|uniref:uncharacterized protein LOC131013791 n=1 Tax=Salvia miltiorrhiza TaxID=226208 RepID=UPI0025ACE534|nr:uncharacterized protein LOC131013791 [Salvia miltiorrhiza]